MSGYSTKRFICDICRKEFIAASDLEEHVQTHESAVKEEKNIPEDSGVAKAPLAPTP